MFFPPQLLGLERGFASSRLATVTGGPRLPPEPRSNKKPETLHVGIGTIFVLTPMIGWTWPALVPILSATAAALGYKSVTDGALKQVLKGRLTEKMENIRRETITMDSVLAEVISEEIGNEQRLAFKRDDFLLVFRKDGRGKFFIDVSGPRELTALNLKIRGEEFARELVKKFAYHKMVEQIQRRGATIVEEEIKADGSSVLKCRQWR